MESEVQLMIFQKRGKLTYPNAQLVKKRNKRVELSVFVKVLTVNRPPLQRG